MANGLVNSNRTVPLVEALPWKSRPATAPDVPPLDDELLAPPLDVLLEAVVLLDVVLPDWLVLVDDGVLLATLVDDVPPVVPVVEPVVVGAVEDPEDVDRGAALVEPALLVELVEPLLMRVLADVALEAVVAVVPVEPLDDELDEPSSTHADTISDAARATNNFGDCTARR